MTVEEIFAKILAHMAKGLMIHDQINHAFGFLNLCGYQKCHEYHYFEESKNYKDLQDYYLKEFFKLLPFENIENPQIIPISWFKHNSFDVDTNTKRNAVKELTQKWIEWEKDTKQELIAYYQELYNLKEICAMLKVAQLLEDVDNELKIAQSKYLNLEAINYDIVSIIEEQQMLYDKYNKKIKHIHKKEE